LSQQQPLMEVTIKGKPEDREFLKRALVNSNIPITIQEEKKGDGPLRFSMPSLVVTASVFIHAIESKPEAFSGEVTLPDGIEISIDADGLKQLKERLTLAMGQTQPTVQAVVWWTYFIPQIAGLIDEVRNFIRWYPRAVGKAEEKVAVRFVLLIVFVVSLTFVLTVYGRISGDAFVFVVGILLGYVFAFLSKYLGLTGGD